MSRLRIAVAGYVVRGPLGGMAWHHLQYVLGLHRLGHDVVFVEDSDDYASCYDPSSHEVTTDPTAGLRFAREAFGRLGLGDRWAYHDAHAGRWHGPEAEAVRHAAAGADVLLDVSGVDPLRDWARRVPVRVLVDTDPVFTQVRHLTDPEARDRAAAHTAFATFAELWGTADCEVPDDGLPWRPTRQPIVLDRWARTPPPADGPWTTVMQWDSYPAREHGGRAYGMKSRSFSEFLDLPKCVDAALELAVGGSTAPRSELNARGWSVADPARAGRTPWTYQAYLRASRGEWSVAKHGYVTARTGWFSERSAAYLASGRPVVAQDTGFGDVLPTGRGLLRFSTCEQAADALAHADADLRGHAAAARALAEDHFAAGPVLTRLLEGAMA